MWKFQLTAMRTRSAELLLLFFIFTFKVSGQSLTNYSGLKGKDLVKCLGSTQEVHEKIQSEMPGQGLPKWGGDKVPGKAEAKSASIDRVGILEDRSVSVRGEITYDGFVPGKLMLAVQNKDGKPIAEIIPVSYNIESSSGIIEFELKVSPTIPENTYLKSEFLKLNYSSKSGAGDKSFCFEFKKRWRVIPKNENITVSIKPEPIGKAMKMSSYATLQRPGNPIKSSGAAESGAKTKPVLADTVDTESAGISSQTFSVFEDFYSDYSFSNPNEISSIRLDAIYLDKNKNSGTYYYLPSSYNLAWEEEEGFKFSMMYGTGGNAGDGNVNMSASLSCDITSFENDFISAVIKNHFAKSNIPFNEAKAVLPYDPKISFQGNLASYNISPDKFSANVVSSIYEPVTMAWTASTDATNEMIAALGENIGITGSLIYSPGEGIPNVSVPMRLKLADKTTFGKLELDKATWRANKWKNKFPYAVKLKNLHAIILIQEGTPCIYTWKLGDKTVPSLAQVQFDAAAIPGWMDSHEKVLRMWMEYEVVPCRECDQEIIDMISSGTTGGKQRTVAFRSLSLLKNFDMKYIKLQVRSKFFDPKGKSTLMRSVMMDSDGKDYTVGPFYVWKDSDLKYEYRLILMDDTQTIEGTGWVYDSALEVYMNKSVAKKSLGAKMPAEK